MKHIFLVALIMQLSSYSLAAPLTVLEKLNEEPVTMLDWGIYKLNNEAFKYFEAPEHSVIQPIIKTSIKESSNQIIVLGNFYIDFKHITTDIALELCEAKVSHIRSMLGVRGDDQLFAKNLSRYFQHEYYGGMSTKNTIDLAKSTIVEVNILSGRDNLEPFEILASCEKALLI